MNTTDEIARRIGRAMQALPDIVAEEAVEYSRRRFTEKAFDGKPWRPVSPNYHPRRGTLLVRSGALLNSVRVASVTPQKVVITAGNSKVAYARAHNEGFAGSAVWFDAQYSRPYELGEGMKGTIGIIGPKRMDYEHVMKTLKTLQGELDAIYNKNPKE